MNNKLRIPQIIQIIYIVILAFIKLYVVSINFIIGKTDRKFNVEY